MSWGQEPPERGGTDRGRTPEPGRGPDPTPPHGPPPDPTGGQQPPPGADWGRQPPGTWGDDPRPDRIRPLNLGDVLDGMFRLAIKHWRAFTIGVGMIVLPLSLLTGLALTLSVGTTPGLLSMLNDPEFQTGLAEGTADFSGINVVAIGATVALTVLANLLFTPLIYGIAIHIAAIGYRDGTVEPTDSVRAAGRRYFALLGTLILLGLVPLLIFLAPMLLLIVGAVTGVDGLAVIGGVGMIVSLVFAIIASIRLSLSVAALLIEGVGPIDALRRSNELVKGKTGLTFGTLLVAYIIVAIIGFVLTIPFNLVSGAVGDTPGAVVNTIAQTLTTLIQNVLIGAALVLVYFDRRVRSEGFDLTQVASELGDPRNQAW